jgi:DNA-binding NarL/FixJ family response regulator
MDAPIRAESLRAVHALPSAGLLPMRADAARSGWRKILLVDPHPLYMLGFAHAMQSSDPQLEILTAMSIGQGLALAHAHPDLQAVILDHGPGSPSGLDGLRVFAAQHPRLVRLLISMDPSPFVTAAARAAGARGCLSKAQTPAEIGAALHVVAAGGQAFCLARDTLQTEGVADFGALPTPRQQEVLGLVSQGLPNKRIARVLGISERTVKLHITALLSLMGAGNRTQLLVLARQNGLA